MSHSNMQRISLVEDDDFDQQQLEMAIAQSLARTDLQASNHATQRREKPSIYGDDDLQRALAESMRTYEEEQQGTTGNHVVGRKRSNSPEQPNSQPQQCLPLQPPDTQQHVAAQLPHTASAGGALKRQRSVSLPDTAEAAGGTVGQPLQQQLERTAGTELGGRRVQRSASVTDAAAGISSGWASLQALGQQQQLLRGLGRSASAQGLAGAGGASGAERGGSRPSSPAARPYRKQQVLGADAALLDDDLLMDLATDELDEEELTHGGSSSMSSVAHESGLPHTISTWGPALLQVAAAAANQGTPRIVGVGPVPGDASDWCIHSRQFYPGQHVYWQQFRSSFSYAGRVLSVDGDGSPTYPTTYTAEIFSHSTLTYVEATAEQLHPQLHAGDRVWCKPAAAKLTQWSGHGPLFQRLHPPNQWLRQHQPAEDLPWVCGIVQQSQVHNGRSPVSEVMLLTPQDRCWFITSQLELVTEIGESSLTAEARHAACVAQQASTALLPPAAAAGCEGAPHQPCNSAEQQQVEQQQQQQDDAKEVQSHLLLEQQQQQQQPQQELSLPQQASAQQGSVGHDAAQCMADTRQQSLPALVTAGAGTAAAAAALTGLGPAAGPEAAPDPDQVMAAGSAAPSVLSRPAAALTAESGLDAAATGKQAGALMLGAQEAQEPAGVRPTPAVPAVAHPAPTGVAGVQVAPGGVGCLPALEGTGESVEGLVVQEVVADSAGLVGEVPAVAVAVAGGVGASAGVGKVAVGEGEGSPKEPVSNQHSAVEDTCATGLAQEGFGET